MMPKLAILAVSLIVVAVLGTFSITKLEERDQFCTSCHLAPETTYHMRTLEAQAVTDPFELADLAGFHYWDDPEFRCVDCHRGDDGFRHRTNVLLLAAEDTLTWAVGQADQTIEKASVPNIDPNSQEWVGPERYNRRPDLLNAGCLKCHQDTLTLVGFDNHFHNKLPAAQTAYDQTEQLYYPPDWGTQVGSSDLLQAEESILTCLDCHRTHVQGFESEFFLDRDRVLFAACVQCHLETGTGPLDLAN